MVFLLGEVLETSFGNSVLYGSCVSSRSRFFINLTATNAEEFAVPGPWLKNGQE